MDEIKYFRQKIPSAAYVPARGGAATEPKEEYQGTYRAIDGALSIEELGRRTGRGEFAITRDVYGLVRSGHVVIHPPQRLALRRPEHRTGASAVPSASSDPD